MAGRASVDPGNWTVMDENSFEKEGYWPSTRLKQWTVIGAGRFGQVHKARHRRWKKDVAVKILGPDDARSDEYYCREAELMLRAESPYIVKVLGLFRGCTPWAGEILVGLVMDLMEGGSLYSLQEKRQRQPLPWPLIFRLVHQVAEGMNHLHSLKPDAIVYKDLKPDNILLDSDLNVKIGGFCIAKFANTVTEPHLQGFCTRFFAPPESLQGGATCAYDVYSYAVLVWKILNPAHVIKIQRDEKSYPVRPSLEDVRRMKAPGLDELVDLIERCWHEDPHQRPTSAECTAVTGRLYEKHGWGGIDDAVRRVQLELDGVQMPGAWCLEPAPDPKRENSDFIPNLNVMMDEKNWKVMDEKCFEGNWKVIGAGGFGQVHKARHRQWGKDVALKLLFRDDGASSEEDLVCEAKVMLRADSPYIVKVLGVFTGCTPRSPIIQVGLVMDLMESGSLDSLQNKRERQLLPWPLIFRLVHQVAEGMNYLHSLKPDAIVHKDLKPDNILLDSDLNVKITDFGIAKFAKSLTAKPLQGVCTDFYSPPEAKEGGATCAYDVYSYAIVVWTILNPAYTIRRGQQSHPVRPPLEDVRRMKAPGLEELVDLMVKCWNQYRYKRPTFAECTAVTGRLFEKHRRGIKDAVRQVQQELVKNT